MRIMIVLAMTMPHIQTLPTTSLALSSSPQLTHADWICYSQRYPEVAERYGTKTLAIRRFFFAHGLRLGHKLMRCEDTFTFKAPDWSELAQYTKLREPRQDCGGRKYGDIYKQFHEQGYAVFTSCSLKKGGDTLERVAAFTRALGRERVLSSNNKHVLEAASDPDTLELLSFLHEDHKLFPFQTLNFKYGTAQPVHSDLAHFDTLPKRGLMAASWLALEDIHARSGPLVVYPGSHQLGLWDFAQLGIAPDMPRKGELVNETSYPLYERAVRDEVQDMEAEVLSSVRKGDTVVWANSLLHGGSPVLDHNRTRLSQVSHYFFEPATIFWVPRLSPEDRHLHRKSPETWATLVATSMRRAASSTARV